MKLIGRYLRGQLTVVNIRKYQYLPEIKDIYDRVYLNI